MGEASGRPLHPRRVVIVDDEPPAREKIRRFLAGDRRVEIVGEAGNGLGAVEVLERERPDLVFLDIQMPELDGFGVLEALEIEPLPRIIFVTAHDEHAVQAFEVRALDYLLKPVDRDRFTLALERALEELERTGREREVRGRRELDGDGGEDEGPTAGDRSLLALARELPPDRRRLERFLVRSRGRMFLLPVVEVEWIGAAGNYVEVHRGKESHLVRGTLREVEERLDPGAFARVHRSAIVNLARIREIQPWSHGDLLLVLESGAEVRLSRRFRDGLQGTFGL